MFPSKVQGPEALSIFSDVNVRNRNGVFSTNIMVFGEHHGVLQCETNALDVFYNNLNNTYEFKNDGERNIWTIGRLLYTLAAQSQSPWDFFIEVRFKEKNIPASAINIHKLFTLFYDCLSPQKQNCQFLPNTHMHAIDYRAFNETYNISMDADNPQSIRALKTIFLGYIQNYYNDMQNFMSPEGFEWGVKDLNPSFSDLPTYDPTYFWNQLASLFQEFDNYDLFKNEGEEIVFLLHRTINALYESPFLIGELLDIFLDYSSDEYIKYVAYHANVFPRYLIKWEALLREFDFSSNNSVVFCYNIYRALKKALVICRFILENNHPSVKMLNGNIVSKASIQLFKASSVFLSNGKSVTKMLMEWLQSQDVRCNRSSALMWDKYFPKDSTSSRFLDYDYLSLLMIRNTTYFMDAPAIARLFLRKSSLKIAYVGDYHRENWVNFFQFCRLQSHTVLSKEDECLVLPGQAKEIFAEVLTRSEMIECEYCPFPAQLKCNVCDKGYTCKKDVYKWKDDHVCKKN